ncbi:C6 zinc finger domain-containing protein [Rutstroemia sp. NJR-2017a WRK4]|nr:C6 zinc finger domain-containing protein [Rutstroemia sp. NJR-2017a WRK4]
MYPYVGSPELDHIIESFQANVNFWYPVMSSIKRNSLRDYILSQNIERSTTVSVLSLLMMSLGCASQSIVNVALPRDLTPEESEYQKARKLMADMYFDGVLKKLYIVHTEMSSTAVQCLFYTADYLAELSGLPESGLASIESSIPLPGDYKTHDSSIDEEHSSLYFLACISMRRLLNRVHNLLYAKETGASLDDAKFPYIVEELDHQLEEWRDFLPPALQFVVDTQPVPSQHGSFLRQRMTAGMLILLAASRLPYLRDLISADVLTIGAHLQTLIKRWVYIPGEHLSPSIEQSLRMISEIDVFLHQEFLVDKDDQV